jgi:hypothetical protein
MAQGSKIAIIYDTPIKQLPQRTAKKIGIDEITESFQAITEDIKQIGKLTTEENTIFSHFLKELKTSRTPKTHRSHRINNTNRCRSGQTSIYTEYRTSR